MEILEFRYKAISQALGQLEKSLSIFKENKYPDMYETARDSLIQRFEFSFDAFWKYLKEYLRDNRKVQVDFPSPNKTFRTCYEQKVIFDDEYKILIDSTRDRNLSSHTYNEKLAEQISERIMSYYETMQVVVDRLNS